MSKAITIGAVAYDAKVVPIWEGIREYFLSEGTEFDYVLFSNYEAQVEALFNRFIDIAWNTNIAYARTDRRLNGRSVILAMRDTDLEFTSVVVVPSTSDAKSLNDLRGKRVAFGSRDSAQAAIIPEFYLKQSGLSADTDYQALRFNSDLGKHGDTGRSELDVVEALRKGDASAGALGESTWNQLAGSNDFKCIWTSPPYSHCNFTALPDLDKAKSDAFVETLLKMDYENPAHRRILEMEGLKRWVKGDRKGYDAVFAAIDSLGCLSAAEPVGAK